MLDGMLAGLVVDDPVVATGAVTGVMIATDAVDNASFPGQRAEPINTGAGDGAQYPAPEHEILADQETFPLGLTPQSLTVCRSEMRFMEDLAPILGRSPRAIKRFVNVYRLLKVALDQSDAPIAVDPSHPFGDFRIVMFLLGIVTGLPTISRELFRMIRQKNNSLQQSAPGTSAIPDSNQLYTVRWAVAQLTTDGGSLYALDLHRLKLWLDSYQDGAWWDVPLTSLTARASQVARYSFRVEEFQAA